MSELIGGWVAGLTATLIREGINKHRAREIAQGYWEAYCKDDEEVERLRAENERLAGCLKKANEQAEHFEREWYLRGDALEIAEAEVERLRADAERLDWLDARGYTYGQSGNETPDGMEWRIDGHTYSLRDAIDAARGES